jgi:hypothetical protein
MQTITREQLIDKAASLLADGTVSCVLGWRKGEFDYDVTPAVFKTADEIKEGFVWNDFCGANFSKYLVAKTDRLEGKMLVFLKPCDTYSFNQLLTEHRFDREKVYAVGIPCAGMADIAKVKAICGEGISSIECADTIKVTTIYDDEAVREAAKQEIIRRYFAALVNARQGMGEASDSAKIELLMKQVGANVNDRPVVTAAL